MLPRNVIEEYLKSYRQYLILEAEKARELKILKQLETTKSDKTMESGSGFSVTSVWVKLGRQIAIGRRPHAKEAQLRRLVENFSSLFRPEAHCETC